MVENASEDILVNPFTRSLIAGAFKGYVIEIGVRCFDAQCSE